MPVKTLKFNFTHPFIGHARVDMPGQPGFPCKQMPLDSKGSNLIEIPLVGFKSGKYNIVLAWEIDNHFFIHQQEFEINATPTLNPAIS
jgi:hypothetical protein